jgi:hypothetical protein
MGEVDQRIGLRVVDPRHLQRLEDQRGAFGEDVFAVGAAVDVAERDRPGLPAVERGIRRILEPVALAQPVEHRAVEIGDMAGHALHLRVGDRLDDDVVADPVDTDLADDLGPGGKSGGQAGGKGKGEGGSQAHGKPPEGADRATMAQRQARSKRSAAALDPTRLSRV